MSRAVPLVAGSQGGLGREWIGGGGGGEAGEGVCYDDYSLTATEILSN